MKILSIRIKNLASLEGITEIDFTQEPLSSAGIFAITGPTGAGKSTILDALCLALYGKTPRYTQARESGIEITDVQGSSISQSDVRGILRDGTGDGFAEVDFAGVDGQRYRANWRVRRAREKADGSLQQYNITLKNIDTNTDIPGKKNEILEEIERLVGLNFEQFTRSVLLAQGDFTAFLKAAKDEKSALLEKLTGTRIYSEISKQIFVNYSKEKRELEDLNLQREGITTLTAEELAAFEMQKATLEKSIETLEKEASSLQKEMNWHAQLRVLQGNCNEAHTKYEQAINAQQNALSREQILKQVEQVQITRSWVDGQQTAEKQLAEKKAAFQELVTTLNDLQQQQEILDKELQTAHEKFAAAIQQQEEAAPLLEEARALDVQIKEKAEQLKLTQEETKTAEDNYQQLEQQITAQQQQSEQLQNSITALQQWRNDNSARQPIAENHALISSKFSDAQVLLDATQQLLPLIETTETKINEAKQVKLHQEEISITIAQKLTIEKEKYDIDSKALAAIPITTIEKEKTTTDAEIEYLITAEAHWKVISNSKSDLNRVKQKLIDNKNDLDNKLQLLTQASADLVIATAVRDSSLRMLDKAKLATADNVESLRSQLIPEDPCPVCGSTEHPYMSEQVQLNHVLAELEAAHQQNEQTYTALLRQENSLRETSKLLKETITQQEQEINTKEAVLASLQKTWEEFTVYPQTTEIPETQIATWLLQQLQNAKHQQKELQQQIQGYTTKKQELDGLQQNILDLERQQHENNNALKDTDRLLLSLEEQEKQYHKDQQNNNQALAAIEQSLSAYFTTPDWFTNWKNDAVLFLQRINSFAEQWKAMIDKLEEDTRQFGILMATLNAAKSQLQTLAIEVEKKKNALTTVTEQQDNLTKKRNTIFNGEAAATIEQELKQAIAVAQQALEKTKSDRDLIQTGITRTGTQKEEAEKNILLLQQQAASFVQKIQEWLSTFNKQHTPVLDMDRLLELLAHNSNWIEAERAALKAINDAVTQAQTIVQERTTQIQQHEQERISERSEEILTELLNTAKTTLEQETQQKNEIGFQLQQDINNKQKIGTLLETIQAKGIITENWAKLNDIIGSADGKKFRLIAQEYTLDVLLGYANKHLEKLSNRYLLQRIPNTLGLQVIDQDMGDEVRTVHSLSGGESFLASLALALGLASLSSSRMQVESLFIDEGFGSLDPATLNIAMDALERLHNQGRKVGVISHVKEMTERIPVQIKVSKQQSGKSKVEVIGV